MQGVGKLEHDLVAQIRELPAHELSQLDAVGLAQLDEHHAALDFGGNEAHRRRDYREFVLIEAQVIHVAQAPAGFRGIAQGLVKVLQVEDAWALVRGNEIEGRAR